MRFIVESKSGEILSRDLPVSEPQVVRALSGACTISFTLHPDEAEAQGIKWKTWGHWVHAETTRWNGERWIIASGLLQPSEVDPETGSLTITLTGFSDYPKEIPWLDNYNPIAVDPFHVIHRIWNHVQSYDHGNLGVQVTPADSNTLLLPGFYFDGSEFVLDFFAYFVRASDYRDCYDEIVSLCRDTPIDFVEASYWNADRTAIVKKIELAYPRRGVRQEGLAFRLGENVMTAAPVSEVEMDWVSDVIVRGWWPGRMHSSTFTNADPDRYRRVIKDEDALINSAERSAVWAKRKLTRRQVPKHFGNITVDMHHPNAPWGTYDVGDDILIAGEVAYHGRIQEWHRIMTMQVDDIAGTVTMTTKHVDGFNYDAIDFER